MTYQSVLHESIGPDVEKIAGLIGDPVRLRVLFSLLDGREAPASELAFRAGSSPQSASAHLRKLVDGGLLAVRNVGRHRLFRLASADVASAIEGLGSIAPIMPTASLNQYTKMQRLRCARACYDHLAGRLGVAVTEALVEGGSLRLRAGVFDCTPAGTRWFRELGMDVNRLRAERRRFAHACLDWTERRHHLAGSLGAAMLAQFIGAGWLERRDSDRALRITPIGSVQFERLFGIGEHIAGRFDSRRTESRGPGLARPTRKPEARDDARPVKSGNDIRA